MKKCEMCNLNEAAGRSQFCKECYILRRKESQRIYDAKILAEKAIEFDENFSRLNLSGLDLLPKRFNELSEIINTAYNTHFGLNWIEVLRHYGKEESLLEALVIEFDKFYKKTGSQSVKKFAVNVGSSDKLFRHINSDIFRNRIDKKDLKSSSRSNVTIEDIKERLPKYLEDIVLLSEDYVNAEAHLHFKCLICEHEYPRRWNSVVSHQSGCPACLRNGVKISKTEMEQHVGDHMYEILEFLGGTADKGTTFTIKCFRGHTYETSYREFNKQQFTKGGSCKTCIKEGYGVSRLEVKRELLERLASLGYSTKDEFNHTQEVMTFICPEGHERVTTYNGLMSYPRCAECHGFVVKHTEDSIAKELNKVGLEYIGNFIDTKQYLTYKCHCGNIDEGMYFDILKLPQCINCATKKHWKLKDVIKYFQDNGCELLEEDYINSRTSMRFKCSCGRVGSRALDSFMYTHLCRECVVESIPTGENHHNWRTYLSDEDRERSRKLTGYNQWRESVLERDNYTCQCCGEHSVPLVAHHKDGYHWCVERRLDVTNGVTLCNQCHNIENVGSFHFVYGNRDNTEEQYNEWLRANKADDLVSL